MSCSNICRLCNKFTISQSVAYASGVLTITIPEGTYVADTKVCLVIAQALPDDTIINAPIVVQVGTGTTLYPLLRKDGSQMVAKNLKTRTRYATCVQTTPTGGAFRIIGNICYDKANNLPSIS